MNAVSIVLLVLTSIFILTSSAWRPAVFALALQYLAAFLLILPSWPLELAAVKLVTGWIAASILGLTLLNLEEELRTPETQVPTSPVFQILAAALVALVVLGAAPRLATWTSAISVAQASGGLLLIGMGLLQLGLRADFFRISIGLLTLFGGFEILYAAVEASTLVAGLLAAVNLGIALVGSYLLLVPTLEEQP